MKGSSGQRALCARCLNAIIFDNRTIDQVVNEKVFPEARETIYGVIRYLPGLSRLVSQYLDKPLRAKDREVWCLLLVGAYQLKFMSIPDHAVINEAVSACNALKRSWAKKLVNAILRHAARDIEEKKFERSFDAIYQYPKWLKSLITDQYPDQSIELLQASLTRAPMALRINIRQISPIDYRSTLTQAGLEFRSGPFPETVILTKPCRTEDLPGFAAGQVSIQDVGAQCAARLLIDQTGGQLQISPTLDACAAPGGKLFHLMELSPPNHQFVALELQDRRAALITSDAARLGHHITTTIGDATSLDWWSGEPFSQILLDAPCSGTGTLRRHPDIKVLINATSIDAHHANQLQLLNNLWPTLRPGGTLLYCTCSLLEQENDRVIEVFVTQQSAAQQSGQRGPNMRAVNQTISLPTGRPTRYGWQLLPSNPDTDGFYFSLLKKPHDTT